jgi:hypothetical protein
MPRRVVTTLGVVVGAALVASTGAIHLHLWATGYRTIPTIGPLFLFQGIAGAALAVAVVAWRLLVMVSAAAGFMVATKRDRPTLRSASKGRTTPDAVASIRP